MDLVMEYYASCPTGFEQALAHELKALGAAQVRPLKGRVSFAGDATCGLRICLWSRLASRVFCVLGRFGAANADELYAGGRALAWEQVLRAGATIAVSARGTNSALSNSHFAALRLKDAICDRLLEVTGQRPRVEVDHPDAHLTLTIRKNRASVAFDLSGDPLFKRLPRRAVSAESGREAHVLRPDYAARVLAELSWAETCQAAHSQADAPRALLLDASCAGGGMVLEAASILADRAPGLDRARWGFKGWAAFDNTAWETLVKEAHARAAAAERTCGRIIACDDSAQARSLTQRLVQSAGLDPWVRVVEPSEAAWSRALAKTGVGDGTEAADSPRGGIVADATEVSLTAQPALLARVRHLRLDARLASFPLAALTRELSLKPVLGASTRSVAVRPNNEEAAICYYAAPQDATEAPADAAEEARHTKQPGQHAVFPAAPTAPATAATTGAPTAAASAALSPASTPSPALEITETIVDLGDGTRIPVLIPESEQFAHRLKKVARLRRKWAKRTGITCYRVYDADLPDYAVAIDLYEGSAATPGRWLVIAEYAPPKSIDPARAQARMLDVLAIAPQVLGVPQNHVFAKARQRARGGSQYAQTHTGKRAASSAATPLIEEGGLTFAVNLDERLDTGIFLDHRITRSLVREHAHGRRWFLNLFAYTGTATCYAADGGAKVTTTVDLSRPSLDWARRNMARNGFTGREHEFVQADVLAWVSEQRHTRNRWDLIFCDVPTFSNSARMRKASFDVQRDHAELIIGVSRLLVRGGSAIFSCNLRTFRPDVEKLERAGVRLTDITDETIPEDFARNRKIHHAYLVERA